MGMRYGHAWASQYDGDDSPAGRLTQELAYAEWGGELVGLDTAALVRGLDIDSRRADHWPPSATEFAAFCRGVPTLAAVRHELRRRKPNDLLSPFVTLLWREFLDAWTFSHESQRTADAALQDAYQLTVAWVMGGGALPEAAPALPKAPEPIRTPARPETVQACVAAVNDTFARTAPAEPAHEEASNA